MIIVDDKGNMFDDRRKEDRRKQDIPVEEERRLNQRRTNTDNVRHQVTEDQIEAIKDPSQAINDSEAEGKSEVDESSEPTSETTTESE